MPGAFDVVTCMEMVEHVPDPGSTVAACAALAKPGGTVIVSTINRNPKSYLFAIVGAEYVLKLLPRGTHDWARFVRPSELAGHARRAGLDLAASTGLVYNPLTKVFRLDPARHRRQLHRGVPQGSLSPGMRALPVDAVLFDLDGTLADTAGDLAGALNRLRRDRGLAPVPMQSLRPHASAGARGLIGAGLGVLPDAPEYPALRDAFLAHYEACLAETTRLFAGVAELLDALDARGLRWGIVTNKAARFTVPVVAALQLADRAATVVSGDTTPHPKPHPEPLFHAARELGIPAYPLRLRRRRPARHHRRERGRHADARGALGLSRHRRAARPLARDRRGRPSAGIARLAALLPGSRRYPGHAPALRIRSSRSFRTARALHSHRLVRGKRSQDGHDHVFGRTQRDAVGQSHAVALLQAEHRGESRLVAHDECPVLDIDDRAQRLRLADQALHELGIETHHRAAIVARDRTGGGTRG